MLKCGGVIAVPTETVYGIATIASSDEGIDRVYAIKGRDHSRPVAICLSKVEEVERWVMGVHGREHSWGREVRVRWHSW